MQPEQRCRATNRCNFRSQIAANHVGVDHRFFDNACCGASIDRRAPTSTVGMLFMMEDRKAVRKPVPSVAAQSPLSASTFSTPEGIRLARRCADRRPRYIPNEKMTICHGAPRSTLPVLMAWPRLATANRITAPTAAIALTGIPSGSRTKNPTSRSIKTIQPVLKVARSLIAFAGAFRRAGRKSVGYPCGRTNAA